MTNEPEGLLCLRVLQIKANVISGYYSVPENMNSHTDFSYKFKILSLYPHNVTYHS